MKRLGLILVLAAFCFAVPKLPTQVHDIDTPGYGRPSQPALPDRVLISAVGDIRATMGCPGKSIAVSGSGTDVAVIYGDPTPDPDNYMEIKIAYSTDGGPTWTTYGPFSGEIRRIYPGVAGTPDFDVNSGELYFTWQESPSGYAVGDQKVMIEEGVPSASSPSTPLSLPQAPDIFPWLGSIAVSPDDPMRLIVTGWSYLNDGNQWAYCWVSSDGGYTWTDTIPMTYIDGNGNSGHVYWGSGDYVVYAFLDTATVSVPVYNNIYPKYMESTDGGLTWGPPTTMPEVPLLATAAQFWWHEFDAMVINDELWFMFNDINQTYPDSAGMWVFHGTGGPGSWSWDIINCGDYDNPTGLVIGDTTFQWLIAQYTSLSHDPVSGRILASAKAQWYIYAGGGADTLASGAHIGGVYTDDNGATWKACRPLSEWHNEQIVYGDWSTTEAAHMIADNNVYSCWINEAELNLYFDGGAIMPVGVAEVDDNVASLKFRLAPTIVTDGNCQIMFTMLNAGNVSVNLYDATGRLVENVLDGRLEAGDHDVSINTSELANGAYFVTLETRSGTVSEKLIQLY